MFYALLLLLPAADNNVGAAVDNRLLLAAPVAINNKLIEQPNWKDYLQDAKRYSRTNYSQRVAVTNNRETINIYHHSQDDVFQNSPTLFNPNQFHPYGAPGGMDNLDYYSDLYVTLPGKVRVWRERVPIANGGMLPKVRWSYPDGTRFVDVLSTKKGVFEVRAREKTDGKWTSSVVHRDRELAPIGYKGAGKACSECHAKAGASEQYGITVRGDDEVFSFPLFKEGTLELDPKWPVDNRQSSLPPRQEEPDFRPSYALLPNRQAVNCST